MSTRKDFTNIQQVIGKLDNLFSMFNNHFYQGELQTPIITSNSNHKTYTKWKTWNGKVRSGYYEINLCDEHLSRPLIDVCETLLCEMAHLANLQNDRDSIYECDENNKLFRTMAKSHGLTVNKTKNGKNKTALAGETTDWLISVLGDEARVILNQEKTELMPVKKRQVSRKYICPCCGTVIIATKKVNILCVDCDEFFEREAK